MSSPHHRAFIALFKQRRLVDFFGKDAVRIVVGSVHGPQSRTTDTRSVKV
ncbi:MAG: hypothetical protein JWN52_4163 [Actinomycetia bacterium]|jgi:hypothetical protein|nr:hypothetical protein [Actinomycetes bacterium]